MGYASRRVNKVVFSFLLILFKDSKRLGCQLYLPDVCKQQLFRYFISY